MKTLNKEAT